MAERGISVRELARRSYCDKSHISRIRNGHARPSPETAANLDQILAAGGELIALAARPHQGPGSSAHLLSPIAGSARKLPPADANYVTDLRQASQQLAALDTRHGGDDLVAIATRTFKTAHSCLASGAYVSAAEHDLQAAVGEAGEVASWIAYDADQQPLSRLLCHEAMLVTRLTGDRSMELFELTHLAMQSIYLHRSAEALRIADDMLGGVQLTGRVAALFHLRRGRALAQLGDRPRALAAIGKARTLLADGIAQCRLAYF